MIQKLVFTRNHTEDDADQGNDAGKNRTKNNMSPPDISLKFKVKGHTSVK